MHEEIVRGTLEELADKYRDADVIGEIVVVLSGEANEVVEISDDDIRKALSDQLAIGASKKAAATQVASQFNVGKNRVYELALHL